MVLAQERRAAARRLARGGLVLALGGVLTACAASGTPAVPAAPSASAHPGHGTLSAAVVPATPTTYADGWRPLTPIAGGPRQEHSVAALDGRIYVIGGITPSGDTFPTTDRVEVYDTATDSWSDAAPLPVAMNHPNVAAAEGRLYVIGGLSGGASWQALPDSFVYDPATNQWTPLPSMPAGSERGSSAVGVSGTTIYLAGGMRTLTPEPGGLHDTVDTVSSYDVVTGAWASLPNLPEARDHVGGAVVDTTFYVLGGRDRGQVNVRDTVYAFDRTTGQWTERAPMPTPRGGIAAAAVGSTIYTFGGESSNSIYTETEAYDTANDRWQQLAPMPAPRHGTAAIAVGDTVYIPGGGNAAGGAPVDVNDAYRP